MSVGCILILSLTLATASCNSSLYFLVIPTTEYTQLCPQYLKWNCTTLEQLSSLTRVGFSNAQNVSVQFLNMTYVLEQSLMFNGARNVQIFGDFNGSVIKCQNTSRFEFTDIQSLDIVYLEFTGCGNDQNNGGALSIRNTDTLSIRNCRFVNNSLTSAVYVSHLNHTTTLTIASCYFVECACSTCGGGAISVDGGTMFLISCWFEDNNAQLGGAVFMGNNGKISVVDSQFINNSANGGGAIFLALSSNFFTHNSHFIGNSASGGGAIFISQAGSISMSSSVFKDNMAQGGGAISLAGNVEVFASRTIFLRNTACWGGAVAALSGSMYTVGSDFSGNTLRLRLCNVASTIIVGSGGAILFGHGSITSVSNRYRNNTALTAGGALYAFYGTISANNDLYANNTANNSGGAVHITVGSISTADSSFVANTAGIYGGGAIYLKNGMFNAARSQFTENSSPVYAGGAVIVATNGSIYSDSSNYTSNRAGVNGGALFIWNGSITLLHCRFTSNSIEAVGGGGGAISIAKGTIHMNHSEYTNNHGGYGGAVFILCGSVISNRSYFINNRANFDGGAIYSTRTRSIPVCDSSRNKIISSYFENNSAGRTAAAVFCVGSEIGLKQSQFIGNSALSQESILYFGSMSLYMQEIYFRHNKGSLYIFNSRLEFHGPTTFVSNSALSGGAVRAAHSQIFFNATSNVTILDNEAIFGGGMWLRESTLHVTVPISISQNRAQVSGGGIYAYQSVIEFRSEGTRHPTRASSIDRNSATINGGGIFAIASSIVLSVSFVSLSANTAGVNGGGIYLQQTSRINIFKNDYEVLSQMPVYTVRLDIANNFAAEYGGGIYVSDNSNAGLVCQAIGTQANDSSSVNECFIQTLELYDPLYTVRNPTNSYNTFLTNNTAMYSGNSIFGGLLDRCTINPSAEVLDRVHTKYLYNISSGFDYLKTTVQMDQIINYKAINFTNTLDEVINGITKADVEGLISSDAVQVLFCEDQSTVVTRNHPYVFKKKGENFVINVVVTDQVGNPVNATVISSASSSSGVSRLKEGQAEQSVGNQCTQLQYNLYSKDDSAKIIMYADGPCNSLGLSQQTVDVVFLPCTCSVGFQPSSSEIECVCECDAQLTLNHITCFPDQNNILLETNIWLGTSNTTNGTGYVIQNCPYDYCVTKPVNISLTSMDEVNKQCANNRTGRLCGECEEGLSLVFASSKCRKCSNYYILLLIPFALAGILLIAFILLLNITIAIGTIHGLVFYANLLAANRATFLPFGSPNFFTIFVSWLNLDLGIETCFYDGMNSQAKVLLQLTFPLYVYLLVIIIIILCKYSDRFSAFFAKRNPIATLCTLILLSYSKLLRTVILALQYTHLNYPDGSVEVVWRYDANVQYFEVSHIPRFLSAFVITILGTSYTILLLFGQCFPRCSRWRLMKWTKNTKYHAFIDAYHAPFNPKHRYWMGLLLLALTVNNLLVSVLSNVFLSIVSVGCTALALVVLKLLIGRVYKNKFQDSLETLFLSNLVVLSIATLFVREAIIQHQQALAITSMAISFVLFVVIISYHLYSYVLKNTKVCISIKRLLRERNRLVRREVVPEVDQVSDEEYENGGHELDDVNPVAAYTGKSTASTDPIPQYYTPPIIRPAVRHDQLREPDLDILDPINTDDYRVPPPQPRIHEPPVITYTVIDAIRR